MIYTKVSEDAMDTLQLNAGVLLSSFDLTDPYTAPDDEDIIATTSGGINTVCEPEFEDFGEDVDNVPNNMMEFKQRTGWNCSMSFTSIKFNASNVAWSLGSATESTLTNGITKIVPNRDVDLDDFQDIWWVGDKIDGGAFAVRLMNALSTGGLNMQSTKNAKGTNKMTITGHVSIDAQDVVPMEFYDIPAPSSSGTTTYYSVAQNLTNVTSSYSGSTSGSSFTATLTANTGYTISSVAVTMAGDDITDTAYDSSTGVITISSVTGNIIITASAAASVYTITQTLTYVTSSLSDTTVSHGDSLTATLTADSGYDLDTVTVTMGGTDVTSTYYDDGVVSISSVTGAVVITATATAS